VFVDQKSIRAFRLSPTTKQAITRNASLQYATPWIRKKDHGNFHSLPLLRWPILAAIKAIPGSTCTIFRVTANGGSQWIESTTKCEFAVGSRRFRRVKNHRRTSQACREKGTRCERSWSYHGLCCFRHKLGRPFGNEVEDDDRTVEVQAGDTLDFMVDCDRDLETSIVFLWSPSVELIELGKSSESITGWKPGFHRNAAADFPSSSQKTPLPASRL